jgi:hypothetical protein
MIFVTITANYCLLISNYKYVSKDGKHVNPITLKQAMINDDEETFDEFQRDAIKGLRLLLESASDFNKAISLFQDVDIDGGGELDIDEFRELLKKIGLDVDETRLQETMDIYDLDGGGTIGSCCAVLYCAVLYCAVY